MRAVYDGLRRRHADIAFVDYAALDDTRLLLTSGETISHHLTCGDAAYCLGEVSAAYLRPHDPRDHGEPRRASVLHSLMNDWAEGSEAVIVNRPSGEITNHSKLRQAERIRESGFLVPRSLVTNDPQRVRAFHAEHGDLIFKSMSSVRSVVKRLDLAALDAIEALGPVLFQERVPGRNVRVHVVGERAFACAVESEGIDYRYAPSRLEPVALPSDIAARCVALTHRLNLLLSGLDLIVTDGGDWYCLEVNPNPGFTAYDLWNDGEIARAVAELLMGSPLP
jgi:glutathione synthase/RimK-type ligase-like ATP-grasp enzyme